VGTVYFGGWDPRIFTIYFGYAEINSQMLLLRFVEQPDVHLAPLLQDISTRVADVAAVVMELKEL
jgi:hypothetical protein